MRIYCRCLDSQAFQIGNTLKKRWVKDQIKRSASVTLIAKSVAFFRCIRRDRKDGQMLQLWDLEIIAKGPLNACTQEAKCS
jgi:hypothetical protein